MAPSRRGRRAAPLAAVTAAAAGCLRMPKPSFTVARGGLGAATAAPHTKTQSPPSAAPKEFEAAKAVAGVLMLAASGRATAVARRASDESELAEARAAAEAAKLELEAAKLRAEATELERASRLERRRARAGALLSGGQDEDGEYTVKVADLPPKLKEQVNMDVTEVEAKRLAAACGVAEDGSFTYEKLASEAFEEELEKIMAEGKQAQAARQQQEREAAQAAAAAETPSPATASTEIENDDRSISSRLAGSAAYVLPLVDSMQFGFVLLTAAPWLAPLLAVLALPAVVVNVIPFGPIILFALCVFLGTNKDLPKIVRFNLQQAVLLDIFFFFPTGLVAVLNGGQLPPELACFTFLVLLFLIAYSIWCTAEGELPDNIPVISDFAKRLMDPVIRPDDEDSSR